MSAEMQISRHWRLNAVRYRLQGERRANGDVRLTGHWVPQAEIAELRQLAESEATKPKMDTVTSDAA